MTMMTDEQISKEAHEYAIKRYDIPFEEDTAMNVIVAEESFENGMRRVLSRIEKEMPLIAGWFEHIAQLATDKKTLNGFVMSDSDTFDEIAALAKRSQEYIKLHLYDK